MSSNNKYMIIGIRFSDNDFWATVEGFLKNLLEVGLESYSDLSKEGIVNLFNKSAMGIYYLVQNRGDYESSPDLENYLKIETKNVYLNEEVKKYIENCNGWDNREFFVLDTKVHTPYIYSI